MSGSRDSRWASRRKTTLLPRARVAMDHGKAAFADLRLLDAPAEVLDTGRHIHRLGRQFWREGIPFEPIEGQQCLVHAGSLSVVGR